MPLDSIPSLDSDVFHHISAQPLSYVFPVLLLILTLVFASRRYGSKSDIPLFDSGEGSAKKRWMNDALALLREGHKKVECCNKDERSISDRCHFSSQMSLTEFVSQYRSQRRYSYPSAVMSISKFLLNKGYSRRFEKSSSLHGTASPFDSAMSNSLHPRNIGFRIPSDYILGQDAPFLILLLHA
jgi:hypothetical protein